MAIHTIMVKQGYQITIDPPPACAGTPDPGTVDVLPVILCSAGNVDLNLSGFTAASGLAFQWQNSLDGSTWSDISGATNTSYSTTLSTSTYYEVIVRTLPTPGISQLLQACTFLWVAVKRLPPLWVLQFAAKAQVSLRFGYWLSRELV